MRKRKLVAMEPYISNCCMYLNLLLLGIKDPTVALVEILAGYML